MENPEFEWDDEKAISNLKKHGVGFEEATTIFNDPLIATIPDPDHSKDEDRYVSIGISAWNFCAGPITGCHSHRTRRKDPLD